MKKSEATAEDCAKAAACELFEGCGQEEISAFLKESGVTVLTFSGRERIPREERRTRWGIVLSGSVRLYAGDESGGEMLLNVVGAGQPFDIASLACGSGNPVRSEAQAAGKCRVAFLGVPEPANFTANYPRIAANVMRFFCGRIGFLTRKIHTLSRGTAERKLADFLLSEFTTDSGTPEVTVKSCAELATRLNLSRASLYRAFGQLEQSGMIARSGKTIVLTDVSALQNV